MAENRQLLFFFAPSFLGGRTKEDRAPRLLASAGSLFRSREEQKFAHLVYLLPPGPCSGAGKNRSSRTSPTASQEMAPLRAHASTSSISAASSIQKPPMCSLVSR